MAAIGKINITIELIARVAGGAPHSIGTATVEPTVTATGEHVIVGFDFPAALREAAHDIEMSLARDTPVDDEPSRE